MSAPLFLTLLVAKALAAGTRVIGDLPSSVVAYIWEDAVLALLFALGAMASPRPRAIGAVYVIVVAFTAINVPVTWALASPLSLAMLHGATPTLSASFAHQVTPAAVLAVLLVVATAAGLPRIGGLRSRRAAGAVVAIALLVLPFGPSATRRVETTGRHQNAVVGFFRSLMDRVPTPGGEDREDIRAVVLAPAGRASGPDLSGLHGAARGRDVVLVILESTGAAYLAPYGADVDPMPNLSRIAATSLVFTQAYCVIPESIRNLDAVLTSTSPAADCRGERSFAVPRVSLPTALRAAGYRSMLFHSGRFAYLNMDEVIAAADLDVAEDAGDIGGELHSSFGVDDPSSVRRALACLDREPPDQRVFLTWLPVSGHHPYDSPGGPFPPTDDFNRYLSALHHADQCLQDLIDGFQARGRDPLVVILGDHGEAFGQHDGNYGHSMFLFQENVHVPLIVSIPGHRESLRVDRVASALDVAPTILAMLGADAPRAWEGKNLLEAGPYAAPMVTDMGPLRLALVDAGWKLVFEPERAALRLYHLPTDPEERVDVAERHRDRADAAAAALLRWCAPERAASAVATPTHGTALPLPDKDRG